MNVTAADLQHYLSSRGTRCCAALDDLSEYIARRPVMPSGTSLLGLVKHLASIEASYLGDCLQRPAPPPLSPGGPRSGGQPPSDIW